MNTLTKVFIVINLVLSCLYCAFTVTLFANRQDWKQKYQDEKRFHEDTITKKDKIIADQKATILTRDTDLEREQAKNSDLTEDLNEVSVQKKEIDAKYSDLDQRHTELDSNYQSTVEKLTKSNEMNTRLRNDLLKSLETSENSKTELLEAREQIVSYKKNISKLNGDVEIADTGRVKLEKELNNLQYTINKLEQHGVDIQSIVARHGDPDVPIHAKVKIVDPDKKIVMLSVGSQDDVKAGFRFIIYQGEVYKGKVQVEQVFPTMCSAVILPGHSAKNETILEGDNASTRVY